MRVIPEQMHDRTQPPGGDYRAWYWCVHCRRWQPAGGPQHDPSRMCRSGGRAHCSCDACF